MPANQIRQLIDQAKQHESQTNNLHRIVTDHLNEIHKLIRIDSENEVEALYQFALEYIELVPTFMKSLQANAFELGLASEVQEIMVIAEEFFLHPPALIAEEHVGMDALLDEAYLAHRMMEELNDLFLSHYGLPLVPQNMTTANLVIHSLIGEPFSVELDELIITLVDGMIERFNQPNWMERLQEAKKAHLSSLVSEWPCMSGRQGISLSLGGV